MKVYAIRKKSTGEFTSGSFWNKQKLRIYTTLGHARGALNQRLQHVPKAQAPDYEVVTFELTEVKT